MSAQLLELDVGEFLLVALARITRGSRVWICLPLTLYLSSIPSALKYSQNSPRSPRADFLLD
jgi:hypothetical protein